MKTQSGFALAVVFTALGVRTAAANQADPAPADNQDSEAEGENLTEELRISRQGLGLDPGALSFGGLVLPPPPGSQVSVTDRRANQLNYHGFLRAPMRLGIGPGDKVAPGVPTGPKLHSPPRVPDSAYTNWQYTNNIGGPWTEMQFSYGNSKVFGTVSLASYNLSDASYKELVAQLGINQAWVTFNLPDLLGDRGGVLWNVGVFAAGYGAAGRYDAGAYGTYLFGRTHTSGETVSVFYDITDDLTLQFEHGIGARLDVQAPTTLEAPFLPYPGPEQQFPTLLHHAHLGVTYLDKIRLAFHYLTSWTQSATTLEQPDGRVTSYGLELKAFDTQYGNIYFGIGRMNTVEPLRVAGAFELLHSWEGWSIKENYYPQEDLRGNGSVTSVMWQWTFSLSTFLRYPESFWGQGPDLLVSTFGLYSKISSDEPLFAQCSDCPRSKLKLGGEVTYTPLAWLGVSGRFDAVRPDQDEPRKSFNVLSPRVLLRTEFVSHEQIILMYSRYFMGSQSVLSYPYDEMMVPADESVVSLIATMWW
jgi:hypothetical protein